MIKPKLNPEDAPVGICDECGYACIGELQDHGIGKYEFWGAIGTHHEWVIASPCCGVKVVKGGQKLIVKTTHTARQHHSNSNIKAGEKYERLVFYHWRENGPGWFTSKKRVINDK